MDELVLESIKGRVGVVGLGVFSGNPFLLTLSRREVYSLSLSMEREGPLSVALAKDILGYSILGYLLLVFLI